MNRATQEKIEFLKKNLGTVKNQPLTNDLDLLENHLMLVNETELRAHLLNEPNSKTQLEIIISLLQKIQQNLKKSDFYATKQNHVHLKWLTDMENTLKLRQDLLVDYVEILRKDIQADKEQDEIKKLRDSGQYGTIMRLAASSETEISHFVYLLIRADKSEHYLKLDNFCRDSWEVVAREFLRMLMPWFPETERFTVPEQKIFGVMSKAVTGFISFADIVAKQGEETLKNKLENPAAKLGEVSYAALLIDEGDFRMENVGFNNQGNVVQIDADQSFYSKHPAASIRNHTSSSLTSADIVHLPFRCIKNASLNWISAETCGKNFPKTDVYRAILKSSMFSSELIHAFVNCHISDKMDKKYLASALISRRDMLVKGALQIEDFQKYLKSDACQHDFMNHLEYLKRFSTKGKKLVEIEKNLEDSVYQSVASCTGHIPMRAQSIKQTLSPVKIKMKVLLNEAEVSRDIVQIQLLETEKLQQEMQDPELQATAKELHRLLPFFQKHVDKIKTIKNNPQSQDEKTLNEIADDIYKSNESIYHESRGIQKNTLALLHRKFHEKKTTKDPIKTKIVTRSGFRINF